MSYKYIPWVVTIIVWAGIAAAETPPEDTLLMFVGEDIKVLSIASRREESAWRAPAVADVITRKDFQERGADTLAKALETVPGFYMAQKESGTQPFVRGIPDSLLLLYDTVPMNSDVSKSIHPFDRELSLAGVKRIEIIRGPGSVLWGPDAFAGIINVVPMSGKDLNGVETQLSYGGPGDQKGFYVNMGHDAGQWNAFMSLSGYEGLSDDTGCQIVRFWESGKDPVSPENRVGWDEPDNSRYFDISARFAYEDWLNISGRFSDNRTSYSMSSSTENLTWCESQDKPGGSIKLEAKKSLNHASALRLTGSFSRMDLDHQIIDRTLRTQKEITYYSELIYDRSLLSGGGLFTGGASYREKHIKNAPIWAGYLPEYLESDNTLFLPLDEDDYNNYADYDTRLWSFFGQYRHKFGDADMWLGLRYDDHDSYEDRLSFSTGLAWSPVSKWVFKLLYGTAYRTPFAKQLRQDASVELEKIKSAGLQAVWEPSQRWHLGVCGFWNRIEDHIMEDPYAGLSLPNHQEFSGIELEGRYSPFQSLNVFANLTFIDHSGPDEIYSLLVERSIDNKGNVINIYDDQSYPYDSGADRLFNFMVNWQPLEKLSTFLKLSYTGDRRLIHPRGKEFLTSPGVWLVDMNMNFKDIFPDTELAFSIKNLTDRRYETPGIYSTIEGDPLTIQVVLKKTW